jgi:hypothetical protein
MLRCRCKRSNRNWTGEEVLIPLRTCAGLPRYTTKVAKCMAAATDHVKTTVGQFDQVLTLCTLLPFPTLRCVHEELHMWVARAQSIVSAVLALHTGRVLAIGTGAYSSINVFGTDKDRTIGIRAVSRIGGRELLNLKVELLDVFLGKDCTANVERNRNLAAFGGKE